MKKTKKPFIKVTGDDGVFFDRVWSQHTETHIQALISGGYVAEIIPNKDVPPCIYRDLTYNDDGSCWGYYEYSWLDGNQFYFPELGINNL